MTDRMFTRRLSEILALILVLLAAPALAQDSVATHRGRGRIVVLMVWDGLRPDFVTERDTPNLFRLAREGVRFDKHHSIFPTLTMERDRARHRCAAGRQRTRGQQFLLATVGRDAEGSDRQR